MSGYHETTHILKPDAAKEESTKRGGLTEERLAEVITHYKVVSKYKVAEPS
jgi:hypothetical protein